MLLRDALCYALVTMTMAVTCIQPEQRSRDTEQRSLEKRLNRRIATLVVDDVTPMGRVFQQPKVIYRRLLKKSYVPAQPTYRPHRTKYGPQRRLKKPGKKYRNKAGSKNTHNPYSYKKRAPNPRFGPAGLPKRANMKPVYGLPQKKHREYNSIRFGEPTLNYLMNKYRPPKPTEFTRTQKPEVTHEDTPTLNMDFTSPESYTDSFSRRPFDDDIMWPQQSHQSINSHHGYGEPPVDSYGAPIKSNLHDLTQSTAQSFVEATSYLDEDRNFGPESRPWGNFGEELDNSFAFSNKHVKQPEPAKTGDVFVTPVPAKQNQELHLNSYSDIYNYRQEEKAKKENKKKKMKLFYQKNVKMLNQPWVGSKIKEESPKDEIIVGGQYAEPPARYVNKVPSGARLYGSNSAFSAFVDDIDQNDVAGPISSYVNYKNSNMAFSPQNLNDVFSIVDK